MANLTIAMTIIVFWLALSGLLAGFLYAELPVGEINIPALPETPSFFDYVGTIWGYIPLFFEFVLISFTAVPILTSVFVGLQLTMLLYILAVIRGN